MAINLEQLLVHFTRVKILIDVNPKLATKPLSETCRTEYVDPVTRGTSWQGGRTSNNLVKSFEKAKKISPNTYLFNNTDLNRLNKEHENKEELKSIYTYFYGKQPDPKQGFAGFPNEYYNHVFDRDISEFENDSYWKEACLQTLQNLA